MCNPLVKRSQTDVLCEKDGLLRKNSRISFPLSRCSRIRGSSNTYIISHYNLSVRIIDLVSHTTYVVCVIFIYKWGDLQFKVDSERQIFYEKHFTAILFTLRIFARNLLRGDRRRNTFRISFWCLAWDSNPGFSSNKPTQYLLDHGDFLYLAEAEFVAVAVE